MRLNSCSSSLVRNHRLGPAQVAALALVAMALVLGLSAGSAQAQSSITYVGRVAGAACRIYLRLRRSNKTPVNGLLDDDASQKIHAADANQLNLFN